MALRRVRTVTVGDKGDSTIETALLEEYFSCHYLTTRASSYWDDDETANQQNRERWGQHRKKKGEAKP